MFYSRYRPKNFNDLINEDHIVSSITSALAKGDSAHAYFFTGPRGTGKTTTARLLAKALNCEDPVVGDALKDRFPNNNPAIKFEPCNNCASCQAINENRHLDIIEIDAASNRSIDNIRELRENIKLSPAMGKVKVYIIDEVHMLTTEASNALLKTLEEPPEHAYFILCTTNPEKVLPTIKSRCQQFQFRRPGADDIVLKLRRIANDQGFEISDDKLRRIAIASKGAFRDAETILEQVVNGDEFIDKLLNESDSNFLEFLSLIKNGDQSGAINFLHELYATGSDVQMFNEKLIEYVRSLILYKLEVKGVENTFELTDAEKDFADLTSVAILKTFIERFSKSLEEYKYAVIATLPLELAIIDLTLDLFGGNSSADTPPTNKTGSAQSNSPKTNQNTTSKSKVNDTNLKKENDTKPKSETPPEKAEAQEKSDISAKAKNQEESKTPEKEENQKSPGSLETNSPENAKNTPQAKQSLEFPFNELITRVKPKNHSIHVILRSCEIEEFDGEILTVKAYYSFHQERLMSHKVREIIEIESEELVGNKVKFKCILSDKKPNAKRLTDKNVKPIKQTGITEDALKEVFGEEVV